MNKYQEAINFITANGLTIRKVKDYDPQSGWHGEHYFVCDGESRIGDLSGNGFCFTDDFFDTHMQAIREYIELKNVKTFEDFKKWADRYAKS